MLEAPKQILESEKEWLREESRMVHWVDMRTRLSAAQRIPRLSESYGEYAEFFKRVIDYQIVYALRRQTSPWRLRVMGDVIDKFIR